MHDKDNIARIVSDILESSDITVEQTVDALGHTAYIGGMDSRKVDGNIERIAIKFYVECTIPNHPTDHSLGFFTDDDIRVVRGIVLADVGEQTDPPNFIGTVYTPEEFIDKYISDEDTQDTIEELFEELLTQAYLKDEWLDKISTLYNNRIAGKPWIVSEMVVC